MASPNDTTYAILRETVPGVTGTAPAFKPLEAVSDTLTFDGKLINSNIMRANRANVASALVTQSGSGEIKTEARRDTTVDLLLESALGGVFVSKVAKGGMLDHAYTIEKKMVENGSPLYFRWAGSYITKFMFSVSPENFGEFTFGVTNMKRTEATAAIGSSTYTPFPTQGPLLSGNDIGTISIGGVTAIYTSLELSVDIAREPVFGLGSSSAVAVNVSPTPRLVKLTATLLRQNISIDAIKGTIVPVSITAGSGTGNGYVFAMPTMMASVPNDQVSGSAGTVKVDFLAVDSGANSDMMITQL